VLLPESWKSRDRPDQASNVSERDDFFLDIKYTQCFSYHTATFSDIHTWHMCVMVAACTRRLFDEAFLP
jgi:hypothetical protein